MKCRNWLAGFLTTMVLLILIQGCNTEKKLSSLVYFNQPGDSMLAKIVQDSEPTIQQGDRISIVISATNPASAAPYNLGSTAPGAAVVNAGYIVEADGTVQLPQLGKIKVAGLKRKQLIDQLTQTLVKFVNDPMVTVEFLNFKITVLGEVGNAGTFTIPSGKVTLIDAIVCPATYLTQPGAITLR
jgi:polysaccharide export outer membrane protein